ncbi:MAG TPA: HD domain-containing protein [Firmicutes bacterium]|nr:HD domain-containing protein [Bacillota bacterium]
MATIPIYGDLLAKVATELTPARLDHTKRVVEQARLLALRHLGDAAEAEIAAVLHDCARDLPPEAQLKHAASFGIVVAEIERANPAVLHAWIGAELAKREYGITSEPVLNAIRWHTTGHPGMTVLEKVIFLADYTELGRRFSGVEQVRDTALENLDDAMLLALSQTIAYVVKRGLILHPITVDARNYFLLKRQTADGSGCK